VRVLVTRPRDQGEATARRLIGLGHEPLLAPVLDVGSTGEPAPGGRFDAVLVTSQNAVQALAAERDRFAGTSVVAVGGRTAERLRDAGLGDVTEAGGDSIALTNFVSGRLPIPASVLHAGGRDRKAEPARSLKAAGFEVVIWECYEARPARELPADAVEALRSCRIGAVLHYSRRSAQVFTQLARRAGLGEALAGTSHLCLSPDVAQGLGTLVGLRLLIAPRPEEGALLALLPRAVPAPGSRPP
jgi:uroporphyrinogen-III synthase